MSKEVPFEKLVCGGLWLLALKRTFEIVQKYRHLRSYLDFDELIMMGMEEE